MPLKEWKKKYYPTPASSPTTMLGALKHALRKWQGLHPRVLKKYNLEISEDRKENTLLTDGDEKLYVTTETCAVCVFVDVKCKKCPLYKVRGMKCDSFDEFDKSPYGAFVNRADPIPMIGLICEAIELVKENNERTTA